MEWVSVYDWLCQTRGDIQRKGLSSLALFYGSLSQESPECRSHWWRWSSWKVTLFLILVFAVRLALGFLNCLAVLSQKCWYQCQGMCGRVESGSQEVNLYQPRLKSAEMPVELQSKVQPVVTSWNFLRWEVSIAVSEGEFLMCIFFGLSCSDVQVYPQDKKISS